MIIKRKLKKVEYEYNTESQELTVRTVDPNSKQTVGKIVVDKTYMFSIFTFIKQIAWRFFIKKGQINQLAKLKREKIAKHDKANGHTQGAKAQIVN